MHKFLLTISLALWAIVQLNADNLRHRYNFNRDWNLLVGDQDSATFFSTPLGLKQGAKSVTLPHAWNEDEAYAVGIKSLSDTVMWYYKTFTLPEADRGRRVLIEFEGARQAAEVWINGHNVGLHENGVMAFGFDLTPFIHQEGKNELCVRVDSDWDYRERATNIKYQWSDRNFNMNMGGLTHNVWLHTMGDVYQTLPLYSNLGTTGVYIYGSRYDIPGRKVTVYVESQVINASDKAERIRLEVEVLDADGRSVARYAGPSQTIAAGDTTILRAAKRIGNMHFWSWGYGYLYTVRTTLVRNGGDRSDVVSTRTGFRQTRFGEGKIRLNDRVIMMHGYAQRSSNEWPAVGIDIPAWLSDFGNRLAVQSGGNIVRWMHVTPSKQEVESCDRVGLIQAMPAGDAEKDREGRQWTQRTELMRDAIIYNRNNPSILFYECGNESISREHMIEMKGIRDRYDPHGGRAIGSREMLDIDEAEYGGEMLYINKSAKHPMFAMEYCRDEGYRMYWDDYSYPYHKHGAGPYYRKAPADTYNQNQDQLTIEQIRRWYDYYIQRPGAGRRISAGGTKIIFSDTNTHGRSEFNYRVSGVVDAMRIPKDAFFANQVIWNSWVDIDYSKTYIIGHWNYPDGVRKDIYVVSTDPVVELLVNGRSVGRSDQAEYGFLHTIREVTFQPGTLRAIGYDADGTTERSQSEIRTAGQADHLRLTLFRNPEGMQADGADLALVQIEVVDKDGIRLPLDNRTIRWSLDGPAEWRGGIAKSNDLDNHILSTQLPVEAGVGRVFVRSTTEAGQIRLTASAKGLDSRTIQWETLPSDPWRLHADDAPNTLPCILDRGETPSGPSYTDRYRTIAIVGATAGANAENAAASFDDNELSEWRNDGKLSTAHISYELAEEVAIDEVSIKLTGWRMRSYPLEIYAGEQLVWKGYTEKSLGYVQLSIPHPVKAKTITIRQTGAATEKEAFGQVTELAGGPATELDLFKTPGSEQVKGELRIVEVDFLKKL